MRCIACIAGTVRAIRGAFTYAGRQMARWHRRRDIAYSHFGPNTRGSTNKSQIAASQTATSTMITAPMMILPHMNGS
jgi:hypothetical protein